MPGMAGPWLCILFDFPITCDFHKNTSIHIYNFIHFHCQFNTVPLHSLNPLQDFPDTLNQDDRHCCAHNTGSDAIQEHGAVTLYALVNPASNHGIQKYVRGDSRYRMPYWKPRLPDRTVNLRLVNDCKVYASLRVHTVTFNRMKSKTQSMASEGCCGVAGTQSEMQ